MCTHSISCITSQSHRAIASPDNTEVRIGGSATDAREPIVRMLSLSNHGQPRSWCATLQWWQGCSHLSANRVRRLSSILAGHPANDRCEH